MAFDLDAFFEEYNDRKGINSNRLASEAAVYAKITAELEKQSKELEKQGKELDKQAKAEIEQSIRARQKYVLSTLELNEQEKITKTNIEFLEKKKEEFRLRKQMLENAQKQTKSDGEKQRLAEELAVVYENQLKNQKLLDGYKTREIKLQEHIAKGATEGATAAERAANAQKRATEFVKKQEENQKLHQRILKENQAIIEDTASTEEERAAARERIAKEQDDDKYRQATTLAQSGFSSASTAMSIVKQAERESQRNKLLDSIFGKISSIEKSLDTSFGAAANFQAQYMGKVDARLQSEEEQTGFFKQLTDDVQKQVGASRFVSQKEVLQNVAKLTEQGVAYNIEQRALLASLSDKMVTTFNVLDDTLQRLIRVQQADLTMSQLGSEALLTKFLNSQFEDTSFLNTMYDSVLGALTDSIASMDRDAATSFTYAVEKWLGSLYSVGLSDTAISSIASGINALATGDISTLNGNQPLSVLMNMSATGAGLSYADLLTQGLNASNVNDLMKSMVEYLGTIADNTTDNQVLRSQWSDVLGITLTDLRAVNNLTRNDISSIYGSQTTYNKSVQETQNQLQTVVGRTSTAERIQNMSNNFMFDWGMNLSQNGAQYLTWYAGQFVDSLLSTFKLDNTIVGKITKLVTALPALSSLSETLGDISSNSGLGLSFNTSGGGLMGILGSLGNLLTLPFNLGASIGSAVGNMLQTMSGNNPSLAGFAWDEYTMRGTDYSQGIQGVLPTQASRALSAYDRAQQDYNDVIITGNTFGTEARVIEGVSSSAYYTTTGATSTINNLVTNATTLANAAASITGLSEEITSGANEIYRELFETQSIPIRVKLAELETSSFNQLNNILSQLDPEGVKLLLQQIQTSIPTKENDANYMMQMVDAVRRM